MSKRRGVMKWFNRLKGIDFVDSDDSTEDVYQSNGFANGNGYSNGYDDSENQTIPYSGNGSQPQSNKSKRSFF